MEVKERKLKIKTWKEYGFIRCSKDKELKFKSLAAQLGFTSIVDFIDRISEKSVRDWREFIK